jgi:hypothetical protein
MREGLGYSCVERQNKVERCYEYENSQDKCKTCQHGYYLSSDGKSCKVYPNGEIGCTRYKQVGENVVCKACDTTRFRFENGVCSPFQKVVANCAVMLAENDCGTCLPNYFLSTTQPSDNEDPDFVNVCLETSLSDCTVAKSETECETCAVGYELESGSCVAKSDSNCAGYDEENKCVSCTGDYFLGSDGLCQAVSEAIADCESYESASSCGRCDSGSVLSSDKSSCTSREAFDDNCDNAHAESGLQCVGCEEGYGLENGACV